MPPHALPRAGGTLRRSAAWAALMSLAAAAAAAAAAQPVTPTSVGPPPGAMSPVNLGPGSPALAPPPQRPAAGALFAPARGAKPSLLAAPPAQAHAGECYARVRIPGEQIYAPPGPPEAVWVLTPGGAGQGPMWCLTYRPGVRTLAGYSPEQSGWIRVLCARKATPAVVRHVQRRLKAWRCYEGKITGHLDARTRNSVMRFQARRRIHHGGYLSQTTLTTLEKTAPPPTFAYAASPPPCATQACPAPPLLPGTALSPTPPTSKPYLTWPGKSLY